MPLFGVAATSGHAQTPPAKAPAKPGAAAPSNAPANPPATAQSPAPTDPAADLAYGAYQRGRFVTALDLAAKRAKADNDPVAMVLVASLYTQGYGVREDAAKARQWYQAAAARAAPMRCSRSA